MASNAVNTISNAASALTVDSPDDFMTTAARSGAAEVEMSKLAAQKATDPEVKKFAQLMVTDHAGVNKQAVALATELQQRQQATAQHDGHGSGIGSGADPEFRTITIDKGSDDGLRANMAVIAASK